MNLSWLVLSTSGHKERNLRKMLSKKKIIFYSPELSLSLHDGETSSSNYVFAKASYSDVHSIKNIERVCNIMYWREKPVAVSSKDIHAIEVFFTQHQNITADFMPVIEEGEIEISSEIIYGVVKDEVVPVSQEIKLSIPVIGLVLEAQRNLEVRKLFEDKTALLEKIP